MIIINYQHTICVQMLLMLQATAQRQCARVSVMECFYFPHSNALTNSSSVKLSIRAASRCICQHTHTDRLTETQTDLHRERQTDT